MEKLFVFQMKQTISVGHHQIGSNNAVISRQFARECACVPLWLGVHLAFMVHSPLCLGVHPAFMVPVPLCLGVHLAFMVRGSLLSRSPLFRCLSSLHVAWSSLSRCLSCLDGASTLSWLYIRVWWMPRPLCLDIYTGWKVPSPLCLLSIQIGKCLAPSV